MKKLFLFAALAVAALSSCSNEDFADSGYSGDPLMENQIAFSTTPKVVSRAGDVTALSTFKTTAITSSGATYFNSESFSLANNVFSSVNPYYWPSSGTLDFYAFNTGIVNYSAGKASMTITNNNGATDYVTATYKGAAKMATVPLTFKHIMSRLSVKIRPHDSTDGYDYSISRVKVSVKGSGKYTFASTTGAVGTWSDVKNYVTHSWTTGLPAQTGKANSGKVVSLPQVFYVIPATNEVDMITFDVEYSVHKNSVLIASYTGDNAAHIEVKNPALAIGKSVCYILEPRYDSSNNSAIAFTATVTSWDAVSDVPVTNESLGEKALAIMTHMGYGDMDLQKIITAAMNQYVDRPLNAGNMETEVNKVVKNYNPEKALDFAWRNYMTAVESEAKGDIQPYSSSNYMNIYRGVFNAVFMMRDLAYKTYSGPLSKQDISTIFDSILMNAPQV